MNPSTAGPTLYGVVYKRTSEWFPPSAPGATEMKFTLLPTVIISGLAFLPGTRAWGNYGTFSRDYYLRDPLADRGDRTGHAIVATIAELRLNNGILPILLSILNHTDSGTPSLASVASWADEIQRPETGPWHYVKAVHDNPPESCRFPGPKERLEDGQWVEDVGGANVLGAIRKYTDILRQSRNNGSTLDNTEVSEALKFLIHFVGDMHQPFHTVTRLRGGNDAEVKWRNKITSKSSGPWLFVEHDLIFEVDLHVLWDKVLVKKAIGATPKKWRKRLSEHDDIESHLHRSYYDRLIRMIQVEYIEKAWASEVESWTKCSTTKPLSHAGGIDEQIVLQSKWRASNTDDGSVCPWYWATGVHELACEWIWPKEFDEKEEPISLDGDEYGGKIAKEMVVEKLLTKGGVRLAAVLNFVFAQREAGSGE